MTEYEYRTHPAISRSELWRIRESPEKFKYYREHPPEPTPALVFGQLFHKMALQPTEVWGEFGVSPTCDRRTKEGKERWKQFQILSEGKTIVTMDMVEQAAEMCAALQANDYCRKLLSGAKETPYFWVDEMTGIDCKCRCDVVTEINGLSVIVDLKSTTNASTDSFMHEAVKYGYGMQAAMYSEGVKANTGKQHLFVFVVQEKEPPYAVNVLQADAPFLQYGYDVFRECIGVYADCVKTGEFFGYLGKYDTINTLSLPSYLAKAVE